MKTQERIRLHLQTQESSTIFQMANALNLTKADIRYHVTRMEKQGILLKTQGSYQNGQGRPAAQYGLNKLYSLELVHTILSSLIKSMDLNSLKDKVLNNISFQIASSLILDTHSTHTTATRLMNNIDYLKSLGFNLRWEAGLTGPRIQIISEPITPLIGENAVTQRILTCLLAELSK